MAAQAALVSPEEYLRLEELAKERHEYVAGVIYAMAGASGAHIEVMRNLAGMLYNALQGQQCQPFTENLKIWIQSMSIYYYPDAVLWCGIDNLSFGRGIIDNPKVIFEVLSESTASLDEGPKFAGYKTLDSLQDYVLIDSRRVSVRVYSREAGSWVVRTLGDIKEEAPIPSGGISLRLSELYDRVSFRQDPAETFQSSG